MQATGKPGSPDNDEGPLRAGRKPPGRTSTSFRYHIAPRGGVVGSGDGRAPALTSLSGAFFLNLLPFARPTRRLSPCSTGVWIELGFWRRNLFANVIVEFGVFVGSPVEVLDFNSGFPRGPKGF